jgi:hypothetical protein
MYTDAREFEKRSAGLGLGWQVAFGVCVGTLAASAITWGAVEARLRWELWQFSKAQQVQTQREGAAQAARDRAAADAERARVQALVESQRSAESARASAAAEVARRDAAWQRFYRPSPGCVPATVSVECANEHIRFKREFEERYAAGRL